MRMSWNCLGWWEMIWILISRNLGDLIKRDRLKVRVVRFVGSVDIRLLKVDRLRNLRDGMDITVVLHFGVMFIMLAHLCNYLRVCPLIVGAHV